MTTTNDPAEYPLTWPEGHGRVARRLKSRFKTSLTNAVKNTRAELAGFGRDSGVAVGKVVISSNATIATHRPQDPGVAVWFMWDGAWHCFAVDLYQTVAENLQAIAKVIEADRVKIRHAGIAFFRSTFKPVASVPLLLAPKQAARPWRQVIDDGFMSGSTSRRMINARYRSHAKAADNNEDRLRELNAARAAAYLEIPE